MWPRSTIDKALRCGFRGTEELAASALSLLGFLMKHSSFLKNSTRDQIRLCIHTWRKPVGLVVLLLVINPVTHKVFSQQDTGRKVKPSSSSTINIREIEKREKERAQEPGRKKLENENLITPPELPVPKGARGKTFRPPTGKKKVALISRRRRRIQKAACRKMHRPSVTALTP